MLRRKQIFSQILYPVIQWPPVGPQKSGTCSESCRCLQGAQINKVNFVLALVGWGLLVVVDGWSLFRLVVSTGLAVPWTQFKVVSKFVIFFRFTVVLARPGASGWTIGSWTFPTSTRSLRRSLQSGRNTRPFRPKRFCICQTRTFS